MDMNALKPMDMGHMGKTIPSKKRPPKPIDTNVFKKVRQLVNNFEFDFSPESVTLEELKSHAIELGGVRSEYRKKNRILFQDQVFGNDVSFNDTLLSLDSSLD